MADGGVDVLHVAPFGGANPRLFCRPLRNHVFRIHDLRARAVQVTVGSAAWRQPLLKTPTAFKREIRRFDGRGTRSLTSMSEQIKIIVGVAQFDVPAWKFLFEP